MQAYAEKHKAYWTQNFHTVAKKARHWSNRVYVFRRITWTDPSPEFLAEMVKRFESTNQLSYSAKTNRLYLYTQERIHEYRKDLDYEPNGRSELDKLTAISDWYVHKTTIKGKSYYVNLACKD